MHMQESSHLVALDKMFSQRITLFIVQLSILCYSHSLWCLECKTKNLFDSFALFNFVFVFFSFFFFKFST
jgi:hypothetical protein